MAYLSPFHREMLERKKPCNSFVANVLRSDADLPCPWFNGVRPLTDAFDQRSKGASWLEVHGLIKLDRSHPTQKFVWSAKGRAYRELIRNSNVGNFSMLRDFPDVPA
jgi:hypothetical protein